MVKSIQRLEGSTGRCLRRGLMLEEMARLAMV